MNARISRRRFLQGAVALAAAAGIPLEMAEAVLAADPTGTTLDRTILRASNSGYSALVYGPGEPHMAHPQNPVQRDPSAPRVPLIAFAQFTDVHIIDSQSPARVEFLDRFSNGQCSSIPFGSAWRPQETLQTQVHSAMVTAVNDVQARRLASGQPPLAFAVSTGDNTDNQQTNELDWFIAGMDGGSLVPNSGGPAYEGVQKPPGTNPLTEPGGDSAYWRPRNGVPDDYKTGSGFPDESRWGFATDAFLTEALRGFSTSSLAMPWYVAYGNHDGLIQGNSPANDAFRAIAVGGTKVFNPGPLSGCETVPVVLGMSLPSGPVTPDPNRKFIKRRDYITRHLNHGHAGNFGHGFTAAQAQAGTAYYVNDSFPGFRFITLDTVNPGGFSEGSIGQGQFDWLKLQLASAGPRYVMLFSHHGLNSLNNPLQDPDPEDPVAERRVLASEVEALLHTSPNVIAWVAGHTHRNRITFRKGSNGHLFWDVESAAHVDWSCQARTVEVFDDGPVLTIRLTLVDHAGPARQADLTTSGTHSVLQLAGIHRELAGNDPQVDLAAGRGPREARNVDLTLPKPVLTSANAGSTGNVNNQVGSTAGQRSPRGYLAVTGADRGLTGGGALALTGAALLWRFRERRETPPQA